MRFAWSTLILFVSMTATSAPPEGSATKTTVVVAKKDFKKDSLLKDAEKLLEEKVIDAAKAPKEAATTCKSLEGYVVIKDVKAGDVLTDDIVAKPFAVRVGTEKIEKWIKVGCWVDILRTKEGDTKLAAERIRVFEMEKAKDKDATKITFLIPRSKLLKYLEAVVEGTENLTLVLRPDGEEEDPPPPPLPPPPPPPGAPLR